MIITYDNSQDDGVNLPPPTQAFSSFSLASSITNITNKSFTISINLSDITQTITEYGFELYKSLNLVSNIGPFNHVESIETTEYTYNYRVKNLEKNQQYTILPYVKLYGETSKTYGNNETVQLSILPDLSLHTDMSYADIRDLDLSSNQLNMDIVNFEDCLVNENTIFSKAGLFIKHYYDYDLSGNNYNFSVDNGDNPTYDFTTIINDPKYSNNTIKNNLKLVRIKQLFRSQIGETMILVKKEFLGFVNTAVFYYSNYIGVLNPSIDNFNLTDYISPNGSKKSLCYKLITKNFTVNNSVNITLNQLRNEDFTLNQLINPEIDPLEPVDYELSIQKMRIIQKSNDFFWVKKVGVSIDCITEPLYRLTNNNIIIRSSFMDNLEDLDTSNLTFMLNYGSGFGITDNSKVVTYNESNILYITYTFLTSGSRFFNADPNSFSKYNYLFEFYFEIISINVIENINQITNTRPSINIFNKNITNRSTTLGCDIILPEGVPIVEVGIYVSTTSSMTNKTHHILEKNGVLIQSQRTVVENVRRNTKRIYPLLKNTKYYVSAYTLYEINSIISTIETPVVEFSTKPISFNISGLTDLSYADLTETDSSIITDSIDLTRAITSTSTPFPVNKKYFDYLQTMLNECINTDGTNDNTSKFRGIDDAITKNKIKKFFIAQYFINNDSATDFGIVTTKFVGLSSDNISPYIKVVKQTTKTISIAEAGRLKETVLYKHMDENDDFEILDRIDSLKIQGPSGPTNEYFFYKNNVLVPKQDGIYTSGSIVDCFSTFNILNGYVIKLNSVEVSEYIYAELSGTKESYYGNTITYTIKLEIVTNHNLTFTLSNGKQIVILNGYTTGSVNTQLLTVETVSVTKVTGGQSHRVVSSGTVTCNILNINATLSTFNTSAYYGDTITYIVTLDQPTNFLLTFTMDYGITISVPINQTSGSSNSIITEVRNGKTLLSVSGDGSQYITLAGTVSTDITKINATLSCSNTSAYYGDVITYSVYLDYPTNEYLEFTMDNGVIIPVLEKKRVGGSNFIITENLNNLRLSSVSGPSKDFVTFLIGTVSDPLLGSVSTTITNINAKLSCSNTTAYYGDVITYIVNLDHPTNSLLTFTMDYDITIPILITETSGSSTSIITEVRNDKTLSVSGPSKDFVNLVGTVSTDISKINATLSSSHTTAYYGDVITYIVNLDRTPNYTLTFTIDGKSFSILKNQTRGSLDIIITENIINKTLSSISGDGSEYLNLVGTVSVDITNIEATLSCSNTTAYYGETITYTVTLDKPTRYELTFTMDYGITISVPINQKSGSSNSIITEVRNNKKLLSVSGDGSQYVTLVGTVSTDMNKEILIENHYIKGEMFIPNVYISQNIQEEVELDWQHDNEKLIEHLRILPEKIKSKLPRKGMYSLTGISEVLENNIQYNFESDISYIHVKPSHILSNKVLFHVTVRSITEYVTKVQIVVGNVVSGPIITPTETNFIYTLESILFEPNTNYDYTVNLFKDEVIDNVSGSFKTDKLSDIQDQTLTEIVTNAVKNIDNTIHIKYYYTITQNAKTIHCEYKCFSSNILTSISDTISWEGSYEVGRFSNELIKYPLDNNKVVEFNIVNANGIYKDIKKVKIHFEDKNIDLNTFHMLEFIE